MNILFAMYGDFGGNSAHPMALHARALRELGHECVAAVAANVASVAEIQEPAFRAASYDEVLSAPRALFRDGRGADIVHAWTPREGVRRFATEYLARSPAPLVVYLEDNEGWIARAALAKVGIPEEVLLQHTEEVISAWTPGGMPHPLRYPAFIGLADAAVVNQAKIASEVPAWVPCTTVMPPVDLEAFAPRPADPALRRRYGIEASERVIVYPGGLNDFTRPGLRSLCEAVGLVNRQGVKCRLLRTGPVALDFLHELAPEARGMVNDLGPLPRAELPPLLSMADVLVQPGRHEPFEDLRLPGKLPEFFASGRPVLLPDTNIAHLLRDGVDAVIHRSGTPAELAEKCLELFRDPARAARIGEAGRRFAQAHFDAKVQGAALASVYQQARAAFSHEIARQVWAADASTVPVPVLLARRLRAMAAARGGEAAALLSAHAELVELMHRRALGLEAGIAIRDRELEDLRAHADLRNRVIELSRALEERDARIAALQASFSWRLTAPVRFAAQLAARLRARFRG